MARPNDVVAELLQEYADLISITGGEAFKTRMYEKAARAVAGYATDVSTLDAKGLQQISNVGKSIAEKIVEFFSLATSRPSSSCGARCPPVCWT